MSFFSERRLIHILASDLAAQQRASGMTATTVPYDTRTANANAQLQDVAHANTLAANQANGQPGVGVGNQSAAVERGQAIQQQGNVDQNGNPTSAGILNQQQNNVGSQSMTYNTQTGNVTPTAPPPTEGQKLQAFAQGRAQQRGVPEGWTDPNVIPSNLSDPTARAQWQASVNQSNTNLLQQQQMQDQQIQKQGADSANASATAASAASKGTPSADVGGMSAALATLPPAAKALAPYFQQILDSITQGQKDSAASTQAMLNGGVVNVDGKPVQVQGIENTYKGIQDKITSMEQGYKTMQDGIQGLVDEAKKQQDNLINQQQQAAQDQAQWTANQEMRQLSVQKAQAVDGVIAKLALTGGFGSSAGISEINATNQSFESQILKVQGDLGIQMTDISAKFTGLHVDATNKYVSDTIGNMKDTQTALDKLETQSFTNDVAKSNAENGIIKNFQTDLTSSRKEYATTVTGMVKDMVTMTNDARKLDQQDQIHEDNLALRKDALASQIQARQDAALTRMDAAGIKQDDSNRNFALKLADDTQKQLERKGGAVDVYSSSKNIAQAFNTGYQQIQDAKTETDPAKAQALRATADAELKVQFSHFMNPGSIRLQDLGGTLTQQNQALWAKWGANISSALGGGGGLNDATRDAMKNIVDNHLNELQQSALEDTMTAMTKVNAFNSTISNPAIQISPSQVISDPEILSAVYAKSSQPVPASSDPASPGLGADDWWSGKNSSAPTSGGSFSPSGQMRTDRNNNPTAMTTDVAKTAGLKEGIDYVKGDPFPDNPNIFTAKLLGDPINMTIKAIDNMGFTTKGGQDRWTYTKDLGLSNASWNKMTHDQKISSIQKMYQREGGSGTLFASIGSFQS